MRKVILEKTVRERLLEEMSIRTKLTDEEVSSMKKTSGRGSSKSKGREPFGMFEKIKRLVWLKTSVLIPRER